MTHPPATCELCGDTGLYSPSALPCPKGCKQFDIVQQANDVLQALSDWAVIYAAEMCDDEVVKQAKSRLLRYGALAYIADATDKLRNVITALSEAEQREKDARAKALEEAAAYHDDLAEQHSASSKEERHHVARDNHAAFCIQHQRHAAAIRALKDEVR